MAKAKKTKPKKKDKVLNYYGINIKVRSDKREITETVYSNLFKRVFTEDITTELSGEKAITINSYNLSNYAFRGDRHPCQYGNLIRYTILEGSHWYNRGARLVENYSTPEGFFPNAYETEYVFIPGAHRLYFKVSAKITINMVLSFIEDAFSKVIQPGEDLKVSLMTSHDFIKTIMEADALKSLKVNISYTNDDLGEEEYDKWMDALLKDAHAGEFDVKVKPDATGNIKTDSPIIQGMLGVAKDNGTAEAKIVMQNGNTRTVKTQKYPSKTSITVAETDSPEQVLFQNTMEKYRNQNE